MVGKLTIFSLAVQTTLVLLTGVLLFDVPVNGGVWTCTWAPGCSLRPRWAWVGHLTIAATQFQDLLQGFFTLLPSILLSGFAFPFEGSPRWVQIVAQVLPLTHFVEILRGVILRGATLGALWLPVVKLSVFLVVAVSVAAARFHKGLD